MHVIKINIPNIKSTNESKCTHALYFISDQLLIILFSLSDSIFRFSDCACVGPLSVLRLPPPVQIMQRVVSVKLLLSMNRRWECEWLIVSLCLHMHIMPSPEVLME